MSAIVRVSAPSRLHFGLVRFAQQAGLSFGGLGMTIREPRTIVELQLAPEWQTAGPLAERALAFAKRAVHSCETYLDSAFHIRVCKAPPPHSGLGTGTQLALAVARGVRELLQLPALDAAGLAACVGRGKRSAVGSHGFLQGGLIWETGRPAAASLGVLARRVEIPAHWRVLLCSLPQQPGLHGEREAAAFESLPPVPKEVTAELLALAEEAILPAAEAADFATFADAVHDYGRLAGSCFTAVQGSSFASPAIELLVDQLREHGIRGVGQSSWGPTVFALAADAAQAATFAERARSLDDCEVLIAAPDNQGAIVEVA